LGSCGTHYCLTGHQTRILFTSIIQRYCTFPRSAKCCEHQMPLLVVPGLRLSRHTILFLQPFLASPCTTLRGQPPAAAIDSAQAFDVRFPFGHRASSGRGKLSFSAASILGLSDGKESASHGINDMYCSSGYAGLEAMKQSIVLCKIRASSYLRRVAVHSKHVCDETSVTCCQYKDCNQTLLPSSQFSLLPTCRHANHSARFLE